jgi:hypothetical protein
MTHIFIYRRTSQHGKLSEMPGRHQKQRQAANKGFLQSSLLSDGINTSDPIKVAHAVSLYKNIRIVTGQPPARVGEFPGSAEPGTMRLRRKLRARYYETSPEAQSQVL